MTRTFPELNEHLYGVLRKIFRDCNMGLDERLVLPCENEIRDLFSNPQKYVRHDTRMYTVLVFQD